MKTRVLVADNDDAIQTVQALLGDVVETALMFAVPLVRIASPPAARE